MPKYKSFYVKRDASAQRFGVDRVTPVTWHFSTKPAHILTRAYRAYNLAPDANTSWLNDSKSVIMSYVDVVSRLYS